MNIKRLCISVVLVLSSLNGMGWGFYGHYQINRMAVFTLPPELFGFYKLHIDYVTDHAADADKRRYAVSEEACRHYLDADHYECCVPIDTIPHRWNDAVNRFTEDTLLNYGIVPWYLEVMKARLTKAFREKDIPAILRLSADIGHYAADLHVPLHSTENYNGQLTGQEGIHALWESRLVELYSKDFNFFVGRAQYIPQLNHAIWDAFSGSFAARDSVLSLEKDVSSAFSESEKYAFTQRGQSMVKNYSAPFCAAYYKRLNGMVERRMQASVLFVGSLWLSAWIDAGQPGLEGTELLPNNEELIKEELSIQEALLRGKILGRDEPH